MRISDCIDYAKMLPGAYLDYPFGVEWAVLRHAGNRKLFLAAFERDGLEQVNLKCDPMEADFLRSAFADVLPGYHMNKRYWNTVVLRGTVPEENIKAMIDHSFDLTRPKLKRRKEQPPAMQSTERLDFRPICYEDIDWLYEITGNGEVTAHLSFERHKTMEETREMLHHYIEEKQCHVFAIVEKASGQEIGIFILKPYERDETLTELTTFYRPEAWGKGYNRETLGSAIAYARDVLGAPGLVGCSLRDNGASAKGLLKSGFVLEKSIHFDNGPAPETLDVFVYRFGEGDKT